MARPRFERPHGAATRGLDLSPKSPLFAGRFGRIFRALPPADYGANDTESITALEALAKAMVAPPDPVTNVADPEESGIPALFTYFGQFIDHDITFDPASSLQRQNDPDALVDFRTPAFDLDSVYGRGIDDQPYLYESNGAFALGGPMTGTATLTGTTKGPIANATDLPRASSRGRAIIGDPRNDENVIVSQFQGLVHRFHNRLIAQGHSFGDAQRLTRWHYQWVVINDFLQKIVHHDVLTDILPHLTKGTNVRKDPPVLRYFKPHNDPFMPLEFSAAAYRFGHSMVRPGYQLNDATLQPIFAYPEAGLPGTPRGLVGFGPFPANWAIDWSRFIDLDPRDPAGPDRLQLAYRIDPSLVKPLLTLPAPVVDVPDPIKSLAERNLIRGWRMRLPSGQAIAHAMGVVPLTDAEITIGKAVDGEPQTPILSIKDSTGQSSFEGACPLWTYVLAEAKAGKNRASLTYNGGKKAIDTPQLGPVGGTIVAETFVGLLLGDRNSYWNIDPLWKPGNGKVYGLREFVAFALGR